MKPQQIRSQKDVEEIVALTKTLEAALEKQLEKPAGYHPHDLAMAVQKAKRLRDAEVNEIRSTFFVIGGKEAHDVQH